MSAKRILILGGYGITGTLISRLLLQYTGIDLIIAGRDLLKADALAVKLNREFDCRRVSGISADASDYNKLIQAFKGCDFVLVASSTAKYADTVVRAALTCDMDYLDINFSSSKLNTVKSYSDDIIDSGRCFITDGGFHPGMAAVLIRYASGFFDKMESAIVSSLIKINWNNYKPARATSIELLEEACNFDTRFFKDGCWYKPKYYEKDIMRKTNFGYPFGVQNTYAMFLGELEAVPDMFPSLKETGFYAGGFNRFVDYFILPGAVISIKTFPGSINLWANLTEWGMVRFSKPPYKTILKLEAKGEKDNHPVQVEITLAHKDGYAFTAMPVAACIMQYLDSIANKSGLHFMAHIVEPGKMIEDLKMMGVEVSVKDLL